jgi:hypothetical protein
VKVIIVIYAIMILLLIKDLMQYEFTVITEWTIAHFDNITVGYDTKNYSDNTEEAYSAE